MELFRRIVYLIQSRRRDRELAAEMEAHREMAALNSGMPLGNVLHLREESREAWGWVWIDRLMQDLRYACRMLRRSPGFTLMAVVMLAAGMGVNIAAFGFFDFMVLRPLNVRQPETLMRLHRRAPEAYAFAVPYPEMAFVREYSKTLSTVLALNFTRLTVDGEERPVRAQFVSENWFTDLRAGSRVGRLLDPAVDGALGAAPVVVLGYGFWQRHFGGDPGVVGRVMRWNGKPATVIGVASEEFTGLNLEAADVWAPVSMQPYFAAGSHLLTEFSTQSGGVEMWGRLAAGVAPRMVESEMASLLAELHRRHPLEIWEKETLRAEPSGFAESLLIGGRSGTGPEERDNIYPVAAMVGTLTFLILAVACGNLGSLLLARGAAREREMSIRFAIGAGRGRLVRQLLTESLLLAALGSAAGLAVGNLLLHGLMLAAGSPAWLDPAPDWRILAFAGATAAISTMLFGVTPAWEIARRRYRSTVARQILIGAQVAASCVLLIVAGLLARALERAASPQPGFDASHAVAIDPQLGGHGYSVAASRAYLAAMVERVGRLPGVESVALTDMPPFGNTTRTGGIAIDGRTADMALNHVSPEFFRTMRIPLLRGRVFLKGEAHALVVSQSLARRLWPSDDPLRQHFAFGTDATGAAIQWNVTGVAADARMIKLQDPDLTEVYFPAAPDEAPSQALVVRTAGPPEALAPAVASIGQALDANLIPSVEPLERGLYRQLRTARYGALAVGVLGATALILACLGIVGVVAFTVSQRVKEIGIRMALGAEPRHVLTVILWRFAAPVGIGLAAGVGGAAALGSVLRRVLYGVSGLDPEAYLLAILLFVAAAAIAAWLPARRALRIDPMRALRCD